MHVNAKCPMLNAEAMPFSLWHQAFSIDVGLHRSYLMNLPVDDASEHRERATRPERAGAAASEGACRGVRGAKPLG
jgi:hypothetical protein